VRGIANRGKSASIKKAYQLLKDAHPTANVDEIFVGVDITIVITINGVKVGIESQGDPNSRLFNSLKRFVEVGCEVIVCATRTSGMTVQVVSDLSSQYQIKWFEKSNVRNAEGQEAANYAVAQDIFLAAKAAIDASPKPHGSKCTHACQA